MGRALSIFLIIVGFLALIGLAFLPREVTVTINVEDSSRTVVESPPVDAPEESAPE